MAPLRQWAAAVSLWKLTKPISASWRYQEPIVALMAAPTRAGHSRSCQQAIRRCPGRAWPFNALVPCRACRQADHRQNHQRKPFTGKPGSITDESKLYGNIADLVAGHETVKHSHQEYVRGDVHTNTVE